MPTMSPVPMDDPRWIAWKAYQQTPEYANTKKWAGHDDHVDGSLWAAFEEGWRLGSLAAAERITASIFGAAGLKVDRG